MITKINEFKKYLSSVKKINEYSEDSTWKFGVIKVNNTDLNIYVRCMYDTPDYIYMSLICSKTDLKNINIEDSNNIEDSIGYATVYENGKDMSEQEILDNFDEYSLRDIDFIQIYNYFENDIPEVLKGESIEIDVLLNLINENNDDTTYKIV